MKKVVIFVLLAMIVSFSQAQTTKSKTKTSDKTKTEVQITDLQKDITTYISKNYKGYKTEEAYEVTTKDVVTYEVTVQKDTQGVILTFDKDGKFLKKQPKPATKTKPATKIKSK